MDILDPKDPNDAVAYRVKVSVKNNLLLSAIENAGYKSAAEFARAAGLSQTAVSALVALRFPPINGNGEFTVAAQTIMEVLGAAPSDLWTTEQLNMSLSRNTKDYYLNGRTVLSILGGNAPRLEGAVFEQDDQPDDHVYEQDVKSVIEQYLDKCTAWEAKILRLRFGIGCEPHSREEIADLFDRTKGRIWQVEQRALSKLRGFASEAGALKDLHEEEYGKASTKTKNIWDEIDEKIEAHQDNLPEEEE